MRGRRRGRLSLCSRRFPSVYSCCPSSSPLYLTPAPRSLASAPPLFRYSAPCGPPSQEMALDVSPGRTISRRSGSLPSPRGGRFLFLPCSCFVPVLRARRRRFFAMPLHPLCSKSCTIARRILGRFWVAFVSILFRWFALLFQSLFVQRLCRLWSNAGPACPHTSLSGVFRFPFRFLLLYSVLLLLLLPHYFSVRPPICGCYPTVSVSDSRFGDLARFTI